MRSIVFCIISMSFLLPILTGHNLNDNKSTIKPHDDNRIQIMSYNLWGLPMWLPKVGINNRFEKACESLVQDNMDIICLQECFSKRLRKKVLEKFNDRYHYTMEYTCSNGIMLGIKRDCHGGLMTFSKFPIIEEYFEPYPIYNSMKKTEKIGNKGFLITSVINQQNDTIIIINTHLYAGQTMDDEYHRMKQILYMDSILTSRKIYHHTCILSGDLNVDHPVVAKERSKPESIVYEYITNQMQFKDSAPTLNNNCYTIDSDRNFYCNSSHGKQKLDYILTRYAESSSIEWEIEEAESIYAEGKSYSDHLAWKVSYALN